MKTDWIWLGPILLVFAPAIVAGTLLGWVIGKAMRKLDDRREARENLGR